MNRVILAFAAGSALTSVLIALGAFLRGIAGPRW